MDKELIEYMTNKLQQHEAPYTEGAWERFAINKEEKKRGIIWWPYWSAAAILFLVAGSLFFGNYLTKNVNNEKTQIVKNPVYQSEKQIETAESNSGNEIINPSQKLENIKAEKESKFIEEVTNTPTLSAQPPSEEIVLATNQTNRLENLQSISSVSVNEAQNWNTPLTVSGSQIKLENPKSDKLTFEEILARDSKIAAAQEQTKTKKKEKIKPDVYIASAMGNDNKVNMNYGFSLSYPIANKLSLSSGVAYAAMSTQQNSNINNAAIAADAAPVSMAFASRNPVQTSKNLESVNARLTGLSIPLDLKYQLSSKLYAGIGVSAVAVLTNNQQNVYNVVQVQNTTFSNANGITENRPLIVNTTQSEAQPESVTQSQDFLGFYNFSFGYRQKITNKSNIGLEPFLRVPMKGFSKDNLNLTNGGLRLKFDF